MPAVIVCPPSVNKASFLSDETMAKIITYDAYGHQKFCLNSVYHLGRAIRVFLLGQFSRLLDSSETSLCRLILCPIMLTNARSAFFFCSSSSSSCMRYLSNFSSLISPFLSKQSFSVSRTSTPTPHRPFSMLIATSVEAFVPMVAWENSLNGVEGGRICFEEQCAKHANRRSGHIKSRLVQVLQCRPWFEAGSFTRTVSTWSLWWKRPGFTNIDTDLVSTLEGVSIDIFTKVTSSLVLTTIHANFSALKSVKVF